jgi:hypothetical protein
MTDIEIDRALALAIGWRDEPNKMRVSNVFGLQVWIGYWANFSHRDWNVIVPIAEKYDFFPWKDCRGDWVNKHYQHTTTPQKAIALAVIGALT